MNFSNSRKGSPSAVNVRFLGGAPARASEIVTRRPEAEIVAWAPEPRNEYRPTWSLCSADSSKKAGASSPSFAKAEMGVSPSATISVQTGMTFAPPAASRSNSALGGWSGIMKTKPSGRPSRRGRPPGRARPRRIRTCPRQHWRERLPGVCCRPSPSRCMPAGQRRFYFPSR